MARRRKSAFERLTSGSLNRKQRRELGRKLYSDTPGLEIVHPDAAGIDVGNESHFAAVPPGRDAQPVRELGSWTADPLRMAEWLKLCSLPAGPCNDANENRGPSEWDKPCFRGCRLGGRACRSESPRGPHSAYRHNRRSPSSPNTVHLIILIRLETSRRWVRWRFRGRKL